MTRILYFWNELRTRGWFLLLGLKNMIKPIFSDLEVLDFSKKEIVYLLKQYGVLCCCELVVV